MHPAAVNEKNEDAGGDDHGDVMMTTTEDAGTTTTTMMVMMMIMILNTVMAHLFIFLDVCCIKLTSAEFHRFGGICSAQRRHRD